MAVISPNNLPAGAQQWYKKGLAAVKSGNFDYAVDAFFNCVEAEPACFEARKMLRDAELKKLGSKGSGKMSMIKGMGSYLKAQALIQGKKWDQAVLVCEKLLRIDPVNISFVKLFAQAAVGAEMADSAIYALEIIRDRNPEDVSVIEWLAALYQTVGRMKSARECVERLCEISPDDLSMTKRLKDITALVSIKNDGWENAEHGGSYKDMLKDKDEAVRLERENKAVKSDSDVDSLIADMLSKIEQEPENINYRRHIAKLYMQKGLFEKAVETIEHCISMNPGDPELDNALSDAHIARFQSQIDALRAAGDEEGAAQKDFEKRQFQFENIQDRVNRYPNDLGLKYQLGVMLYDNDYWNEAAQQFQQSQRNPKVRPLSLFYLGMCFKQKKQYDMAMETLQKASSEIYGMDKTKKEIIYEMGTICELTGEPEKALAFYKEIYQVDIGYRDVTQKIESSYS